MKMSIDDKKPNDLSFKLFQNKPLDLTFLETYFIFYVKSNLAIIQFCINQPLGMPISRRFSFLGDSGNRGMAICHSSGIGETKTYSQGSLGNLGEYFVSDL